MIVAIVALVPGIAAWWTGRRIAARATDPVLPELLFARSQRLVNISTTAFVATAFVGGRHAYWGALVITASMIAGGYPLRRALGLETDGLVRHLWRSAKSIVGGLGFWLLLLVTPEIVLALDPRDRLFSLLLIPILLAWENWYPRIWLWLHDSRPLSGDELLSRIDAIVARAGIIAPRVYRIGGTGTRFMNALAFPSVQHPSIGLGNALVELLESDEVAAIYAHELSHIEQYSRRKIRRLQALTRAQIVIAVLAPLIALKVAPSFAFVVPWLWLAALVGTMIWRSRQRKAQETESDARAAELCGDPEVVVRALIKVHVHGFIPRRWSVDVERGATHPSLARRIQALRGESAVSTAVVSGLTVLATAREGSTIVFDNTRAHWFDGVPAGTALELEALRAHATSARSVTWPDLVELRVETKGDGRALKAMHKNGDSWSVPLDATHIEPVQKALDVMDVRLHRDLGKAPVFGTRLVSALLVVAILWTGEVGVLIVPAMLALFRPSTASLAALGAMASFGAVLELANRFSLSGAEPQLLILGVLGMAAVWMAWHRARHEKKRDGVGLTAGILGVVAAASLAFGASQAMGEYSLSGVAQSAVGVAFALSMVGLAAALVMVPRRTVKWGAAAAGGLALLSAGPSITGSGLFGNAGTFTRTRATATEIGRVALGSNAGALHLSPNGSRFLIQGLEEDGDDSDVRNALRFTIGAVDGIGVTRSVAASQADFADDEHLLVLQETKTGAEVRFERADSGVVWNTSLPSLRQPVLSVSPHDHSWAIVADDPKSDSLVFVSGVFDKADFAVRRLANDRSKNDARRADGYQRFVVGERVIVPEFDIQRMSPVPGFGLRPRAELWEISGEGSRAIGRLEGFPTCGPADNGYAVCVVRSRFDRGEVWVVERAGPARYVGQIPLGQIGRVTIGPGGRISGAPRQGRVLDADAGARRFTDVRLPNDSSSGFVFEVRTVPGRIAVVTRGSAGTTLIFYRVP